MAISEIDEVLRRYRAAIFRIGILRAFTRATISALRLTRSIMPRPYSGPARGNRSFLYLAVKGGGTPFPAARIPPTDSPINGGIQASDLRA